MARVPLRRLGAALAVAAAAVAVTATAAATSAAPRPAGGTSAQVQKQVQNLRAQLRDGRLGDQHGVDRVCASHHLACQAQVLTVAKRSSAPLALAAPVGYGARELEQAYGLKGQSMAAGTVVVIGAGAYPTLESDLAVYRSAYGMPACTVANGCFRQMNYQGGAPYAPAQRPVLQFAEEEIAVETAIDVDMASAACPRCKIVSMQVPLLDGFYGNKQHIHNAILHFATGVDTAATMGASAVSISYGYPTDSYSDAGAIAAMMKHPGMAITSSSGDGGFLGRIGQWPQDLSTVTSVGGTSLYRQKNSRGYEETAWNYAGSGCTKDVAPSVGQPSAVSALCRGKRAASDVSAVADLFTGVAIYDSYAPGSGEPLGYTVAGGTSVSSPFVAGMYARIASNPTVVGPNTVYANAAANPDAFTDVTIGTNAGVGYCETRGFDNRLCDSGAGWDGPTGVGTPYGVSGLAG